jgi:P27 family predicted phage terminase small subunit
MVQATGRRAGRPPKPSMASGASVQADVPKPPRELGKKGKELWNTLWINGRNHLSVTDDYSLLLLTCRAWDELEWCHTEKQKLKESGMLNQLTPNGFFATHPVVKMEKELFVQYTAWIRELGFTPTARTSMGIGIQVVDDPMDKMKEIMRRNAEINGAVDGS